MKFNFTLCKASAVLILSVVLITFSATLNKVFAQVQIAPISLFLSGNQQGDRMIVRNSGNEPIDIEVQMLYGYPYTKVDGSVFMKIYDEIPDDEPSAVSWIRVYPRLLTLLPGERQVIRFSARPPAGLPSGEYWVRPAFVSQNPIEVRNDSQNENISTNLMMRRRTILSINYRHGSVQTGIAVETISAQYENSRLTLQADLSRGGNAAFIGHSNIRIYDFQNRLIQTSTNEIAVYKDQFRRFRVDTGELNPGTYRVELELITSQRSEEGILQTAPVKSSASFEIP